MSPFTDWRKTKRQLAPTLMLFSVLFFLSKWTLFLFSVSEVEDEAGRNAALCPPMGEDRFVQLLAAALRSLCVAHSYRTRNLRLV